MRQWFAVRSKRYYETRAAATLVERGVETYLPRVPGRQRRGRRVAPVEPLFPGYFFARVAIDTSEWVVVRSTPGVAYVVGAPGAPAALRDELLEEIRLRSDKSLHHGWQPPFKRGDLVTIKRGPFAGLDAIFEGSLSPNGRVRVLLEILSRAVVVDVDIGLLRAHPRGVKHDGFRAVG